MKVDLKGKQWVTFGLKGQGKTEFNNRLIQSADGQVLVFDPMDEYDDAPNVDRYVPESTRGDAATEELTFCLDEYLADRRDDYEHFLVDEITRYHTKGAKLDGPLGELLDLNRHWEMGIGFIARRPSRVHTTIREMADYWFLFRLRGQNDIAMLNNVAAGLSDAMRELLVEHPQYSYIVVDEGRGYQIEPPL